MGNRIILHIDMNSYFASVEQQANPFLRGKPVGVCAYLSPGGCIIASSAEAKQKGIKTGCTVREALALDPKVVLLENEPAKYRSTTEKLYAILKAYTDRMEPYSIDEAFLDLTGWVKGWVKAEKIGREIQARIKAEIGGWLNSSVGISFTKFLAKFASDIAPKKSMLVIDTREKLAGLLKDRPLTDAWGINIRMEARFNFLGIKNLLDLKNYSPDRIRRALGRYGYYLWAGVNGEEITSVLAGAPAPKSVGHSYCVPKHTTDKGYLAPVLYKLCEKAGRRLRALDREARVIQVGWAYTRAGGVHKSWTLPEPMFTAEEIFTPASSFLSSARLLLPVRMLFISVARLEPVSAQMSLFEDNLSRKELSRALDKLNDKYGEYTVIRGAMWGTADAARDRIGFRKTVA
ncbi:MAG: DNA polymerase IV [Planctomycetes bacterium]|nr:DNA polymerase IV [Planctomycetota bacterium]